MKSVKFPPVIFHWELKVKLKGDIILFVVCEDIQVQEKMFKNPNLAKGCNSKAILLCCSPIFIITRVLPKVAILKVDSTMPSCFISHLCIAT